MIKLSFHGSMCSVFLFQLGRGCSDGLQVQISQNILFPCEILGGLGMAGDFFTLGYFGVCGEVS